MMACPSGENDLFKAACALGECGDCEDGNGIIQQTCNFLNTVCEGREITGHAWEYVEKKTQEGKLYRSFEKISKVWRTVGSFTTHFKTTAIGFKKHFFFWQYQRRSELIFREKIFHGVNPNVFHGYFDISENYKHMTDSYQPAPTHYSHKSYSILTLVGFLHTGGQLEKIEVFVITDDLTHDSRITGKCLRVAEGWLSNRFPAISTFRVYVDNAPQHFRTNAFLRSLKDSTSTDGIPRHLCFHGQFHGKTVGDSAGGFLKAHLYQSTALNSLHSLEEIVDHINTKYVPTDRAKTTMRRALAVSKNEVRRFVIPGGCAIPQLKKHYSYLIMRPDAAGRTRLQQRIASCFCEHCTECNYAACSDPYRLGRIVCSV